MDLRRPPAGPLGPQSRRGGSAGGMVTSCALFRYHMPRFAPRLFFIAQAASTSNSHFCHSYHLGEFIRSPWRLTMPVACTRCKIQANQRQLTCAQLNQSSIIKSQETPLFWAVSFGFPILSSGLSVWTGLWESSCLGLRSSSRAHSCKNVHRILENRFESLFFLWTLDHGTTGIKASASRTSLDD